MMRMLLAALFNFMLFVFPATALSVISGPSTVYTNGSSQVLRSNGGAGGNTMHDLLPGGGSAFAVDTILTVYNDDPTGLLEIRAAAGSLLDGGTRFVLLGPKQAATFLSDGTDYRTIDKPDRTRIRSLPGYLSSDPEAWIGVVPQVGVVALPTFYVNPTPCGVPAVPPCGDDNNSGIDANSAFLTIQAAWDFIINEVHLNNQGLTIKLAHGTYAKGLVASFTNTGYNTKGIPFVILEGDVLCHTCVHISPTPGPNEGPDAILASSQVYLYLRGMKLSAPSGSAIKAVFYGFVTTWDQVGFGSTLGAQVRSETDGYVNLHKPFAIHGGTATNFAVTTEGGNILSNAPYAVVLGNVTYSDSTVKADGGLIRITHPFIPSPPSVTVTGVKARASDNGIVRGLSFIPGSAPAATPTTQGQIL